MIERACEISFRNSNPDTSNCAKHADDQAIRNGLHPQSNAQAQLQKYVLENPKTLPLDLAVITAGRRTEIGENFVRMM